jgi:hypothetical protein
VKIAPTGQPDNGQGSVLGQMSLEKTFHGGMSGTSRARCLPPPVWRKRTRGFT